MGEASVGEALASTRKAGLVEAKASPTLFPSNNFPQPNLSDFLPRAADAFLADFGDGLVACFEGFAFFVAGFGQLHHDELALAAVFEHLSCMTAWAVVAEPRKSPARYDSC